MYTYSIIYFTVLKEYTPKSQAYFSEPQSDKLPVSYNHKVFILRSNLPHLAIRNNSNLYSTTAAEYQIHIFLLPFSAPKDSACDVFH